MRIFNKDYELALNKWQQRALIILGAVIGGVAVNYIIRWIEQRRKGATSDTAVPPQS